MGKPASYYLVADERAEEIASIEGISDDATTILLALAEKAGVYEGAHDNIASDDPVRVVSRAYRDTARAMYDAAIATAKESACA